MKKIFSRFFTLATMAVAGATFVACGSEDDVATPGSKTDDGKTPSTTVTSYYVNLTVGSPATSDNRALSLSGTYLSSPWATSDNIYVFDDSWNQFGGKLNPTSEGTKQDVDGKPAYVATVKGTITSTAAMTTKLAVGSKLNMMYPRTTWSYEGQDGTLETIAKNYAYAIAKNVEVTEMSGTDITDANPNPIRFENQQAIVKISLTDKNGNALSVNSLVIRDFAGGLVQSVTTDGNETETKGALTVTASAATNEWYVALRGVSAGSEMVVIGTQGTGQASTSYAFTGKISADLENGKYYVLPLQNKEITDDALTIEAAGNNTTVRFFNKAEGPVTMKVLNTDGTLRNVVQAPAGESGQANLQTGQRVLFYGNNTTYTKITGEGTTREQVDFSYIHVTGGNGNYAYLYNNIMSLVDGEEWSTKDYSNYALTGKAAFAGLFSLPNINNKNNLTNHSSKKLVLPATTLSQGCYQSLLERTHFAKAPELPADVLANYCYARMFYQTDIEESPVLGAEDLALGCYNEMFTDCFNLKTVKCYATTLPSGSVLNPSNNGCTNNWMSRAGESVTGTKEFYMNVRDASKLNEYVEVANHFVNSDDETYSSSAGTSYPRTTFMNSNEYVFWSIGTGGIPSGWTVKAKQ